MPFFHPRSAYFNYNQHRIPIQTCFFSLEIDSFVNEPTNKINSKSGRIEICIATDWYAKKFTLGLNCALMCMQFEFFVCSIEISLTPIFKMIDRFPAEHSNPMNYDLTWFQCAHFLWIHWIFNVNFAIASENGNLTSSLVVRNYKYIVVFAYHFELCHLRSI